MLTVRDVWERVGSDSITIRDDDTLLQTGRENRRREDG